MTIHLLSPRDMVVLTVLAEHYGAPLDLVARMLGVSLPSAYRIVRKWRGAHMVSNLKIRPVPGPTWVFPTKSAVEALLPFWARYWTPTPKMAAHVVTVLEARLALVGLDLDRWISERELRAQLGPAKPGEPRPHVHDGRWLDSAGDWRAVEIELTVKGPQVAKAAVARAKKAAHGVCAGITYYCADPEITDRYGNPTGQRSDEIRNLIRAAARETASVEGPSVRVAGLSELLPDRGSAVRPGLMVIAGGAADHGPQAGKAVS
ncbi:hypothetical protein ABZ413_36605 [Nocardia rhamnosiphila]|uniref:hypothetical protein n=1 Tax=Nocardia rhamnosiphila TaxID=426716 RepID=UPI0034034210